MAVDCRGESAKRATGSEASADDRLKTYCSDLVALQFARYFIYVVGQVQAIAWCLSFSLLMLMLVLNSYSPQAPLLLGRFLAAIFIAIGVVVFWVFAGMERNAILSCMGKTQPGQLNYEFWFQLLGMGILPLIGVLSHLFPALSNILSSLAAPGMETLTSLHRDGNALPERMRNCTPEHPKNIVESYSGNIQPMLRILM